MTADWRLAMGKGTLKKDITFIYLDKAQEHLYAPLEEEARRRGYATRLTDDKFARCEIGFYCEHVNHPQYSKFSVILLHDIIQQYSNWPDIWYREPWDKYDLGILPSRQWVSNWSQCSQWPYARPRNGVFLAGWPKADAIAELSGERRAQELASAIGLDGGKRTVLYAPAWENDRKQDDFVKAMNGLGVNALVKQAPWVESLYPQQVANIREMEELHCGKEGVFILPPETNIFTAISLSDVLVSEESSTMCEAAMMGVPAISVSDWLIPDTVPSRYPKCDYDFVTKTTRAELRQCVTGILDDYASARAETEEFASNNFSNVGNASSIIVDIVDDCASGKAPRYPRLAEAPLRKPPLSKEAWRLGYCAKKEVACNYGVRYAPVKAALDVARDVKHRFQGRSA